MPADQPEPAAISPLGVSPLRFRGGYIYAHRSVRSIRLTTARLSAGVAVATALSLAVGLYGSVLADAHGRICAFLLRLAGIPVLGSRELDTFAPIGRAIAPLVPIPLYSHSDWRLSIVFAASVLVLILIYRHVRLARNFLVFLLALLALPAAVIVLGDTFSIDSPTFTQIWLRLETLVWLLLPWVSASLFFPIERSVPKAIGWLLLTQAYGLCWSAVRLAFCLAVFHYTGILFVLLFWFCLGLLGDLLYLLVFYSLAVRESCNGMWGRSA